MLPAKPTLILFSLVLIFVLSSCAPARNAPAPTAVSLPVTPDPVVLVCDIDVLTEDSELNALSPALSSLFRRDMFCVRELSIVPSDDVQIPMKPFFLKEEGLKRLGLAHGADIVITGFLEMPSGKVSIQMAAYDLATNSFVFKTRVSGRLPAIFGLEKRLVEELCSALNVKIDEDEHQKIYSQIPGSYSTFIAYGNGLMNDKRGKTAEALIAYQKATMNKGALALALAAEAQTYAHMNAPLKAMQSYQKAVGQDPSFAEAWYRLNLYAVQFEKNDQKALEYCRKALEIAPRFGKARLSLGTRLHDLGHLSEAVVETRKAAEVLRTDPIPPYNLGLYYLEVGDRASARAYFERSLQLDPHFEPATTELRQMVAK